MNEYEEHKAIALEKNILFLPKLYADTLNLLFRAHEYFNYFGKYDQEGMTEEERLIYSSEMSRVTLRLTSIMSWLTIRKAVFDGKMDEEEAAQEDNELSFQSACLMENLDMHHMLPPEMVNLLNDSRHLFQRIQRLDRMILEDTPATRH